MATKTTTAKRKVPAAKTARTSTTGKAPTPAIPALPANELPRTPPATAEEFLLHIRILGQHVREHVDFMCRADKLPGTSTEAKRKALAQFHARLFLLEQELNRIKEELQLG
jgi:hypothetical protein